MSDIRCPMCGKLNPGDADVCQYCQARLKPLTAPIQPPKPEKEKGDAVDWLRSLAGRDEGLAGQPEAGTPETPAEMPPEEIPDWLSRIRQKTKEETDSVSPIGRPPAVEPPPEKPAGETPPAPAAAAGDWLQDLRSPEEPEETPAPAAGVEPVPQPSASENLDNDEWLRSFSARMDAMRADAGQDSALPEGSGQPEEPAAAEGPALQGGGPAVQGEEPQPAKAEIPEWMKALEPLKSKSDQPPAAAEGPEVQGAEEGPLSQPPMTEAETPGEGGPAPEVTASPAESIPDWLKAFAASDAEGLAVQGEEPAAAAAQGPAEGPEVGPALAVPKAGGEAAPAEGVPDWLKAFAASAAEGPAVQGEGPAVQGAEEPAAVAQSPAEGPEVGPALAVPKAGGEAAPAEGVPDWLKAFAAAEGPAVQGAEEPSAATAQGPAEGPEVGPAPAAPEAASEAAPAEGVPDWLKAFAAAEGPEVQGEEPAAAAAQGPEIPEVGPAPAAPQAGAEASPAEGVPDWLKAFAAEEPAAAAESPEIPEVGPVTAAPKAGSEAAPAEGIPDWLKAFAASAPEVQGEEPAAQAPVGGATPAFVEGEAAPAEGIPDWLKAYAAPQETTEAGETSPQHEAQPAPPVAGETPDWLRAYADHQAEVEQPASQAEGAAPLPAVSPFSEEGLPDWLKAGQAAPAAEGPAFQGEPPAEVQGEPPAAAPGLIGLTEEELAGPAHPLAGEEMPEWLSQPEEEGAAQPAAAEAGQGENLETAQLPAWLQAMRPVESAAPAVAEGVDEQRVEKSGPLAGLRGVVRGEDLVTQYQKPPVYSVKLRVSEPQTLRASLMEQVLGSETAAQPVAPEPTLAPQYVVRVATGLAMVALILVVLFFGPRPLIPAALSRVDPQVSAVNKLVNNLQPGSPVLVAVDYQAPLAGELKIASQPVIQHLMLRQARLVFVSTNPVGPALAQDLFTSSIGSTGYKTELAANLGYLIGGSTALKAMAAPADAANAHPLRDALPQVWSASGSWNVPALYGLSQVNDFKQVILLTDSVESARDWVEQVQPELAAKNVPLIVVSSAQAAPLLQAYQDSGQFAALISGLAGGANYEQVRQSGGNGTAYFNAYLAGILAAVLFILLGGIVSLVSNLASPKTKRKA